MLIPQQKLTATVFDIAKGLFGSSTGMHHLKHYIPKKNLFWTGSGREALRHILSSIGARNVGLPSFTCHAVLDAVKRSSAKHVFIDSSVIVAYEAIETAINKIDTLVLPYNFGFLPDIEKIKALCVKHDVALVEDCCQALGATYNGKLAGSFGDYSFYSFGISKNIGFLGGMVATDGLLPEPKASSYPIPVLLKAIGEASVNSIFFNRHVYPYVEGILDKELERGQDALRYTMPWIGKNVIRQMAKRYGKILKVRQENAAYCMEQLEGIVDFVRPLPHTEPSWLYFAIMADKRNELMKKLREQGVAIGPLLTFKDLSTTGKLAKDTERRHAAFALHRSREETEYICKAIRKASA